METESKRLHRQDAFRVAGWLNGKLDKIKGKQISQRAAAEQCGKELGLDMSYQTIAAVFKDMGHQWPKGCPVTGGGKSDRSRVLARNILVLHKAICQLANADVAEFGYADVRAIADGQPANGGGA